MKVFCVWLFLILCRSNYFALPSKRHAKHPRPPRGSPPEHELQRDDDLNRRAYYGNPNFFFWVYEIFDSGKMSHVDLEQGSGGDHRRSFAGSEVSADGSVCISDADYASCHSQFSSTNGGSSDEYRFAFVCDPEAGVVVSDNDSPRASSASDCSSIFVEVESGVPEIKVQLAKVVKDCRICHPGLESNSHESGVLIKLGCSCKDDLAAAHKNCAEVWFKIRGNKTCEICQSVARNVAGASEVELTEQTTEAK
ncbi:hypothetical protein FNV43_RR09542 [Rhamnella rubrinervis]|uniref:RING-CH-type domain-containing protein n=1 Tax=Rhamnella rubrinervis TaxID=2594499 RepID=A0A8K0HBG6_9ROSA|nr:hypothetical protein FNV43_RR09542 [Rhamnella rubrinervis]